MKAGQTTVIGYRAPSPPLYPKRRQICYTIGRRTKSHLLHQNASLYFYNLLVFCDKILSPFYVMIKNIEEKGAKSYFYSPYKQYLSNLETSFQFF